MKFNQNIYKNEKVSNCKRRIGSYKPNTKSHEKFTDIYELFVSNIFFESYNRSMAIIRGGLFNDRIDCKKWLENYFNIKLN